MPCFDSFAKAATQRERSKKDKSLGRVFVVSNYFEHPRIKSAELLVNQIGAELSDCLEQVYIPNLHTTETSKIMRAIEYIQLSGKEAVPHIPVRKYAKEQMEEFLALCRERSVRNVFLVGGEMHKEATYASVVDFLREDILRKYDIEDVGVASYPEGHPFLSDDVLLEVLLEKQKICREQNISMHTVTQLLLDPHKVVNWQQKVRKQGVEEIVIGLVDLEPEAYIRFAERCGYGSADEMKSQYPTGYDRILRNENTIKNIIELFPSSDFHLYARAIRNW